MNQRKWRKGFLGPIGDDLPSLIPLLFALIMFFYVFTFTWNVFDKRDAAFNDAMSILRIGNALKGNNYIASREKFMERCETAKAVHGMRFLAGLLELPIGEGERFEGIDVERIGRGGQRFFSNHEGKKFECSNTQEKPRLVNETPIVRVFPIALEFRGEKDKFYVKPMLLVVIAWK